MKKELKSPIKFGRAVLEQHLAHMYTNRWSDPETIVFRSIIKEITRVIGKNSPRRSCSACNRIDYLRRLNFNATVITLI